MVAQKYQMLAEERRNKVQEIVEENGRVTVEEIVTKFGVSAVTARADLDILAKRGSAMRSHGGAVRQLNPVVDYPLRFKAAIHHAEKIRIAHAAVQMIKPHQTILLDSGTTTAQVARQIKASGIHPLTVITNALNVAYELTETDGLSLIMLGGILRPSSSSFVGPQADHMLRDLHADHLFLAVDGLHADIGYSTPDILEAQLNSVMIRVSSEVTVVADASKFGRRSLSLIGKIENASRIITDNRVDAVMAEAVRAKGVELVIV